MSDEAKMSRRRLLSDGAKCVGGAGVAAGMLYLLGQKGGAQAGGMVWQLDPNKCIQCGNCATYCVLKTSAVKCVHAFALCGYCDLGTGYFEPQPNERTSAAENQLCPTGAIKRTFVEDPYYQYTIDEPLCVGCGKCVKGCNAFGNGSLFLQVRHDRCLNCNQCSIATACPAGAYRRVPKDRPYLLKSPQAPKGEVVE
jgi:Na+-translocating ferredoxin:NAD+ oxidoreductase subunit B